MIHRHTGGMKRLLVLPLLAATSPALTAPIYLTCNEMEVIKNTYIRDVGGNISGKPQSLDPIKNIPVTILPYLGTAKVGDSHYSLIASSDRYELKNSDLPPATYGFDYITRSVDNTLTINSQTLAMEVTRSSFLARSFQLPSGYAIEEFTGDRKAVGSCKISPAPAPAAETSNRIDPFKE